MADNPLNAVNRGVYISDNLPFLQSLNDGCVDLVCIDPPFAKNETFGRKNSKAPDPLKPPLSDEEKATEVALLQRWGISNEQDATAAGIDWPETKYKDFWSWQDVHESWLKNIEDDHPGVHKLIEATQEIHGDSTAAYLCYIAVRLFEIRRVLKATGSLYLHCDHTAGAYLRQLLDGIFGNGENGNRGFRNEITWKRQNSNNSATTRYGNITDTILFYAKSEKPLGTSRTTNNAPKRKCESTERTQTTRLYKANDLRFTSPTPNPSRMFAWRGDYAKKREKRLEVLERKVGRTSRSRQDTTWPKWKT